MKIVKAKIIDSTHLELERPIHDNKGKYIQIVLTDEDEDELWKKKAKEHFLEAYDAQDEIYDKL